MAQFCLSIPVSHHDVTGSQTTQYPEPEATKRNSAIINLNLCFSYCDKS